MVVLYVKLAFATAVVLAPGWLLARTLGVRSVSASLAWSLVAVFGALAITFALGSTLTLTLALLVLVAVAAARAPPLPALARRRDRSSACLGALLGCDRRRAPVGRGTVGAR